MTKQPEAPVIFQSDGSDWAIDTLAHGIIDNLNAVAPGKGYIATSWQPFNRKIIHFGTRGLLRKHAFSHGSQNKLVVTSLHGNLDEGPLMAEPIQTMIDKIDRISFVVTSCEALRKRHNEWGIPEDKLVTIPLGVDQSLFTPPTEEQRLAARKKFGIPEGLYCIGSFQKDGNGWGEGNEPKLVKGPDILVDALALAAKEIPVIALLTGPARGYVKRGLQEQNVPFCHHFIESQADLATAYHALDLVLISSRDEGGPLALLEGMASGVPVVSSRVGMSIDIILDGENGYLVDVGSPDALAAAMVKALSNRELWDHLSKTAGESVDHCDWRNIAEQHWRLVYAPLINAAT